MTLAEVKLKIRTILNETGSEDSFSLISVDTVKACLTDRTEDISDYIRTFGSRLDSNCYLWQSKMSVGAGTIAL